MRWYFTVLREHTPGAELDDAALDEMYDLYGPHHDVDRGDFADRVRGGFDHVVRFRERGSRRLVGFTAVRSRIIRLSSGRRLPTLYSGLSFVLPEARGLGLLPAVLSYYALRLKLRAPTETVWVWSDAISYKPYILTARRLTRVYPSRHGPTPAFVRELRDRLGADYYGDLYDAATGCVRKLHKRLKDHVAPIRAQDLRDPDIRFYAEHNPGHADGHGLMMLIPADVKNILTVLAYRRPSAPRSRPTTELAEA
ncbi:MAG: hypothetical protein KC486_08240 [Myxococcales bacterium]|nr:hypothetical protein [Myxococcales bacterium]